MNRNNTDADQLIQHHPGEFKNFQNETNLRDQHSLLTRYFNYLTYYCAFSYIILFIVYLNTINNLAYLDGGGQVSTFDLANLYGNISHSWGLSAIICLIKSFAFIYSGLSKNK